MAAAICFISLLLVFLSVWRSESLTLSSRLVHRFSDEAAAAAASRGGRAPPARRSAAYYEVLMKSDLARRKRRLGGAGFPMLYPAEGSETLSFGNDFGWLHYTWIDVGTPNVSFLVALDAGSDLFWVPCDCIQCAPLSGYNDSMDKDLGMYSPTESQTSKHISCSHELCASGPNCESPKQPCPYIVNYNSENTSSSGLLVEDKLYLVTADGHTPVQADVVIGCGRRQSGGYLEGIAPDGLLGLGFGDISVPSVLSRAGLIRNSFSICFREDNSGRILFGDLGISTQESTPFLAVNGKYPTYIAEVESFCIGAHCVGKTSFQALIDSGSSFTFIPVEVYKRVTEEFDRQVNASRFYPDNSSFEYCYKASQLEMPEVPSVVVMFAINTSFVAMSPIYAIYNNEEELAGFCLALQSSEEDLGTIGQNFMTGYHMVFDRENLKLSWSHSDCPDPDNSRRVHLTPPSSHNRPEIPLPDEQQSSPAGRAVSPAVAVRAPTINPSAAAPQYTLLFIFLLLVALQVFVVVTV